MAKAMADQEQEDIQRWTKTRVASIPFDVTAVNLENLSKAQ